jgi:hypothetical protein
MIGVLKHTGIPYQHQVTNLLLLPPPQLLYNSLNSHFAMIAFLLRLLIEKLTNTNPYYKISKHMAGMLPLSWSLLRVQEPHPTSQPWLSFMINYTFQDHTSNKRAQTSTSSPSIMPCLSCYINVSLKITNHYLIFITTLKLLTLYSIHFSSSSVSITLSDTKQHHLTNRITSKSHYPPLSCQI